MYNLMKELKFLREELERQSNFQGVQAVNQAMARIENLTYDVERYEDVLKIKNRRFGRCLV